MKIRGGMRGVICVFISIILIQNVFAQKGKTGYVAIDSVIVLLPEYKTAQEEVQKYAIELQNTFDELVKEYNKKQQEFQEKGETLPKIKKDMLLDDLSNLEKKIQDFQSKGYQELQKKQQEVLMPLVKRAKEIVAEVAKEHGYRAVFDVGAVIYMADGEDILPLVKEKIEKMKKEQQNRETGTGASKPQEAQEKK